MTDTTKPTTTGPTGKVGNLTRDPSLKITAAGKPIVEFGIACKPYTPRDQPPAEPTFYEIVAFGSLAESISECLVKGDRVVVVGEGRIEHWSTKTGEERTTKKILADACGPDLRFSAASIERTERRAPASASPADTDQEPF